jgi:Methyltransferase domain
MKSLSEILNQDDFFSFNKIENKIILDVGCKNGKTLLEIYSEKSLRFSEFIGIDLLFKEKNKNEIHDIIFDGYLSFTGGGNLFALKEAIYPTLENSFHFYPIDLNNIEDVTLSSCHLIVLSNILHLFEKNRAEELIKFFSSILLPKGILFIKVANENHKLGEQKSENYEGPKWGLTLEGLRDIVKEMNILYEENGDSNRQIIVQKPF